MVEPYIDYHQDDEEDEDIKGDEKHQSYWGLFKIDVSIDWQLEGLNS